MRNTSGYRKLCLRAGAAIALAAGLTFPAAAIAQDDGAPPATQEAGAATQQNARTDADIQSDVAYALTHDSHLEGQRVSAYTAHGIITLTGDVQSEQQRQAAETAAASVQGVSGIQNNITVNGKPAQGSAPSQPAQQSPVAADDDTPPPPPDEEPSTAAPRQQDQSATGENPPPPPPDQSQPTHPARPAYPSQPSAQPGYSQPIPAPPYPYYPPPARPVSGPVTIPQGTLLQIRTEQPLDIARVQAGQTFEATAASDVFEGNVLAIPRGALLEGTVVSTKKPGSLGGNGEIQLQITSLNLGGRSYPLATDIWTNKTPNKTGYTARNTVGGSLLGAIIGGAVGGGGGAAAGAIVGGVGGMAASSATNPHVVLPPEMLLNFHLGTPVTVQPVSWQEAQRLASNARPQLQRRRVYMAPPYPYPYGYPYPYPYYRGW